MGRLNRRRLERLEDRLRSSRPSGESLAAAPEDAKQRWLAHAKARRFVATHEGKGWLEEFHAHDVFRLLRTQGNLPGTAEEIRDRLLAWRPPLAPHAVDRVLARAIFEGEEGTEGMECPPEWAEAFEAADELRERYMEAPSEELAEILVAAHRLQGGAAEDADAVGEWIDAELERLGITEELGRKAIGPDGDEIPEEERWRRVMEAVADFYYGEKGYEVQQHITRLVNEERSEP